jgi:hypothetical protein
MDRPSPFKRLIGELLDALIPEKSPVRDPEEEARELERFIMEQGYVDITPPAFD